MRNSSERLWVPPLAVAMACLLVTPYLGIQGILGISLLTIAVGAALLSAYLGLLPRLRNDKYDLNELRMVHERSLFEQLELDHAVSESPETIICTKCGTSYSVRFPVCTNCGRLPG